MNNCGTKASGKYLDVVAVGSVVCSILLRSNADNVLKLESKE
jgi:hypothetical protein